MPEAGTPPRGAPSASARAPDPAPTPPRRQARGAAREERLARCVLTAGGATRAQFAPSGAAVWLEPSGAAFTLTGSAGGAARGLTACARSEQRQRLGAALRFRNMHCGMLAGEQEEELLPYVEDDAALLEACGYGAAFESRRNLASVAWPSSARTGAAAGLVAQAGSGSGAVSVRSLDRAAHLLLAGHGAHFCVSYPLRIGDASADGVAGRYVWQLQAFPATRGCYPARWAPALALALAAREGGGAPTEAQASELLDSQSPTTLASVGAGGGVTALPVASCRATGAVAGWADLADLAWWRSQSMHSYADGDASHAPAVEWRPECTLHFVAPVNEVRGTLAADSSLVETAAGGLLVRHVTAPGDEGSTTLATAGVPDHIYTRSPGASAGADAGRVRVPLGPAARRAVAMRAAAAAGAVAAEQAAKQSALVADSAGGSQLSATVLTRVEVPREGAFSAYADGRVRVQFRDRTLLELDAARETADVILPDGSRQVVRCAAPVGCGRYVADALQFAAWAFKSPDERAEVMRAQRRVDGQLAANARHEAVCTLAVSGRYEGPAGIVADEAPRAAPPAVVPVDRLDSTEADDARRGREAARVAGAGTTEGGGATGSSVECAAEESLAPLARRDGGGAGCAAPPVPRVPAAEWDALLPGGSSTAAGRQLLVEEMLKRNDEHMRRLAEVLETN